MQTVRKFDEVNQSKTDAFEIKATQIEIITNYYSATMDVYLRIYYKVALASQLAVQYAALFLPGGGEIEPHTKFSERKGA